MTYIGNEILNRKKLRKIQFTGYKFVGKGTIIARKQKYCINCRKINIKIIDLC